MSTLKEHQAVLLELLEEFDRICKKHNISYALFAGSALGTIRHKGFIPWDDDLDVVMLRPEYEKFLEIAPREASNKYFVQSEFSEHWNMHFSKFRKNNTTCLEKYHPKDSEIHQGIYIDLFPCDNLSDIHFVRRIQFFAARLVIIKTLAWRGYETDSIVKRISVALNWLIPKEICKKLALLKSKSDSKAVHTFFGGSKKYKKGIYPREWFTETTLMQFEHLMVPISVHYDKMLTKMYGDYMIPLSQDDRKCKIHAILVDVQKNYTEYKNYRDGMSFDTYTRSIR